MKKYLIQTVQKNNYNKSVATTKVTIDWEKREFEEFSKVTFSDGFSFDSKSLFKDNLLYLNDEPVASTAQHWLNNSAYLIIFSVAAYHNTPLVASEEAISGTGQELMSICENQLNLSELGEKLTYTLTLENSNTEKGVNISLIVCKENGDSVMEQTVHEKIYP